MSYTTKKTTYNGHKILEISKNGKRVLSFGVNKANAIIECIEQIKQFVGENNSPVRNIDVSSLSPEQVEALLKTIGQKK